MFFLIIIIFIFLALLLIGILIKILIKIIFPPQSSESSPTLPQSFPIKNEEQRSNNKKISKYVSDRSNYKKDFWNDNNWIKEYLFKNNVISEKQYWKFKGRSGIYKIEIYTRWGKKIYIGQSEDLSKRIAYHIDTAYREKEKKQLISYLILKNHNDPHSIKWNVIDYAQKPFNTKEELREWLNKKEKEYIKDYKNKVGWRNMANSDGGGIYY